MAHIEAEIWFLTHEAGGRRFPVVSGYRPQFFYDNRDWDAIHEYLGTDKVAPGEKVLARLTFLSPQCHAGRVSVGMPFLVREGPQTIGYGIVRALIDLQSMPSGDQPI